MHDKNYIQSLERGLKILELFRERPESYGWGGYGFLEKCRVTEEF